MFVFGNVEYSSSWLYKWDCNNYCWRGTYAVPRRRGSAVTHRPVYLSTDGAPAGASTRLDFARYFGARSSPPPLLFTLFGLAPSQPRPVYDPSVLLAQVTKKSN